MPIPQIVIRHSSFSCLKAPSTINHQHQPQHRRHASLVRSARRHSGTFWFPLRQTSFFHTRRTIWINWIRLWALGRISANETTNSMPSAVASRRPVWSVSLPTWRPTGTLKNPRTSNKRQELKSNGYFLVLVILSTSRSTVPSRRGQYNSETSSQRSRPTAHCDHTTWAMRIPEREDENLTVEQYAPQFLPR